MRGGQARTEEHVISKPNSPQKQFPFKNGHVLWHLVMALLEKTKRAGSRKCPQVYRKKPAGEGRSAESLEPSAGLGYQLTKPLTSPPDLWSCLYPQVLPRLRVWPTTVPRNVQAKGLEVISIRVLGGPREGTAPVPTGQQLGTNSVCKGWWWWVPRETAGVPQGARAQRQRESRWGPEGRRNPG